MKISRDIIMILFWAIFVTLGILHLTKLLSDMEFNDDFFRALSSISTSIASIGGLLLLLVTFLYLIETRKMAMESKRQTELQEDPAVSLKVAPDSKDHNFLFLSLKNTGGGPAYDISVEFVPDMEYRDTTLNQLTMFRNMPLLDKGEEVRFFYDSAVSFFNSQRPKQVQAEITYYKTPSQSKGSKCYSRKITINFEERKGQLHLVRRDVHDLVNEIEELKHALLISTIEKRSDGKDD